MPAAFRGCVSRVRSTRREHIVVITRSSRRVANIAEIILLLPLSVESCIREVQIAQPTLSMGRRCVNERRLNFPWVLRNTVIELIDVSLFPGILEKCERNGNIVFTTPI